MGLRRKKSLIDQAADYVEGVIPQIESALTGAKDRAMPVLNDARDKAAPVLNDARDKAAPVIADARAKATPILAEGAAVAADRASVGATLAAEKAAQGRDLAVAKLAEIQGKPAPKKGGKLKKVLLLGGLAAAGGFVYSKLKGGSTSDNWQSSYTPTPAPATPPTPAAPASGATESDDPSGSSPDEALADATDQPHAVSTPDDPADVVDIDQDSPSGSHRA
ncbi:MAG: hypothetical protein ACRDOM_01180 [Nocardioides sp.]